jgi:peptidoglycan-N-acetylglucosamine deacetylase
MRTRMPRLPFRPTLRRYQAILIGSILLLTGAVIPSGWDSPLHRLPRPEIQMPAHRPVIAFTFDDGPHPGKTMELLEVLHREHVPATFFVVGKMADRYPHLVHEIDRQGHELANHTYNHYRLSKLDNEVVMHELDLTRDSLRRITGRDIRLYRPPGGDFTRRTLRLASHAGYQMILWNILTRDVDGASPAFIRRRILGGAKDGAIILMHSGVQSTIDVLPEVIETLRADGYDFVTVSKLIGTPRTPLDHPQTPPAKPLLRTASALRSSAPAPAVAPHVIETAYARPSPSVQPLP